MSEVIFFVILGAIGIVMGYVLYVEDRRRRAEFDSLPEPEHTADEVREIDMNGHAIFLADSELPLWDKLTNKQKMHIHLNQKAKIKSGEILKVTDNNGKIGLITRKEALLKGVLIQYLDAKGNEQVVKRERAIELGIIKK